MENAANFDPYFKWLGIGPKDQPPHHYRLLGIDLWEADGDVIANAADRQMAHLRTFQSGKYAQHSQRLLNEISAARLCLLSAEQKSKYDAQLRARLQVHQPPSPAPPAARPLAAPTPVASAIPAAAPSAPRPAQPLVQAGPSISSPARRLRSQRKKSPQGVLIAGGAAALVLVLAVVVLSNRNGKPAVGQAQVPAGPAAKQPLAERPPRIPAGHSNTGKQPSAVESEAPQPAPSEAEEEGEIKPPAIGSQDSDLPTPLIGDAPRVDPPSSESAGNLLAAIDPAVHAVAGNWSRDGDKLIVAPSERARIMVPQELGRRYRVEVAARRTGGTGGLTIGLPIDLDRMVQLVLSEEGATGLRLVGGAPLLEPRGDLFSGGVVLFRVEVEGSEIAVWAGGEELLEWEGDPASLTVAEEWSVPVPRQAFLGAHEAAFEITRVDVQSRRRREPVASDPSPSQPDRLLPVPEAAALAKAVGLVKDVFKDDYAAARSAADRASLAARLLQEARRTAEDAAGSYALLAEARGLAEGAGDVKVAIEAVEELGRRYEVALPALRLECLDNVLKNASVEQSAALAETAQAMTQDALAEEDYAGAKGLHAVALSAVRKTRDGNQIKALMEAGKEMEAQERLHARLQQALQALREKPDDPAASLEAGRLYAFDKGDWQKALPLLAAGSDEGLKAAALADLKGPPDAEAQAQLGDQWWDLSDKHQGGDKIELQGRAAHWYQRALPALTGLAKTRVERRLDALSTLAVKAARSVTVQVGGSILSVSLSSDSKVLAVLLSGGSLRLFDGATGRQLDTSFAPSGATAAGGFTPDGRTLYTVGYDGTITVWDARSGQPRDRISTSQEVNRVRFSPDGSLVALGQSPGRFVVFDVKSKQQVATVGGVEGRFRFSLPIEEVHFTFDNRLVTVGAQVGEGGRRARVRDLRGSTRSTTVVSNMPGTTLAPLADGRLAVAAEGSLQFFDSRNERPLGSATVHTQPITALAANSKGGLAAGCQDGSVRLAAPRSSQTREVWKGEGAIVDLCFTPDGATLAAAANDGTVFIWRGR